MWEQIVRTDALGQPAPGPGWLDRPALARTTISTRNCCAASPPSIGQSVPTSRSGPYSFLLAEHVDPLARQAPTPGAFTPPPPTPPTRASGGKLRWIDCRTGEPYRITTTRPDSRAHR